MKDKIKIITFVEKIYGNNERVISERAETRDPFSIKFDGMTSFRFYDLRVIEYDGETFLGQMKRNVSPTIYFGTKRVDESGSICIDCNNGLRQYCKSSDVTIEELENKKRMMRDRTITMSRKQFFSAITKVLSSFENMDYTFSIQLLSKWGIASDYYNAPNRLESIYTIKLYDSVLVSDVKVFDIRETKEDLYFADRDTTISMARIIELFGPLYDVFPYMQSLIDQIRIKVLLSGDIREEDIISIANTYASEHYDKEKSQSIEKRQRMEL